MKRGAVLGVGLLLLTVGAASAPTLTAAADEPQNNLVSILASGQPAIGLYTGALAAPRVAKILATSDLDFVIADIEHGIYDFPALQTFLVEFFDFHHRFRTQPRLAPDVIVKVSHRGGWDPRHEIAQSLKMGPAGAVMVPVVESRTEVERMVAAFELSEQASMAGLNLKGQAGHTGVSPLWPLNPKGQLMLVVMIETEEGARNAEAIITTPGLGAVYATHLSDADAAKVLKLALQHKVIVGTDTTPDNVQATVAAGYRLITLGWDFRMLQIALADSVKKGRAGIAPTAGRGGVR